MRCHIIIAIFCESDVKTGQTAGAKEKQSILSEFTPEYFYVAVVLSANVFKVSKTQVFGSCD